MTTIIGHVKIQASGGAGVSGPPISVPVFGIPVDKYSGQVDREEEALRVKTPGGIGFLPVSEENSYYSTHVQLNYNGRLQFIHAVPRYMDITLSGLGGTLSDANGTHRAEFHYYDEWHYLGIGWICYLHGWLQWQYYISPPGIFVDLEWCETRWRVAVTHGANSNCIKYFDRNDPDPNGSFSEGSCDDTECDDTDTCYKSSGATCSVAAV